MMNAWSMALSAADRWQAGPPQNETQSQNARTVYLRDIRPVKSDMETANLVTMRTHERGLAGPQSRRQPRAGRSDSGRLAHDICELDPDVLVIIAGVNDIYRGLGAEAVQYELPTTAHTHRA